MKSPKHNLLPLIVFLTGASVLIVEVVAVRVLSPYYGNTIFTVSSVISVILLALSFGYYAGGKLADRHPSFQWFFGIILVSGLVLLLCHVLGTVLLPLVSSKLSISSGPLASAALLFLIPALLLGMLSPYAVKLQSTHFPEQGIGSVAGNIFFWSTLGSITGSLLAGFVLIPHFGSNQILISNGVLLFLLGLAPLCLFSGGRTHWLTVLLSVGAVFGSVWLTTHRLGAQVLYAKDGVYERLAVYDGMYAGRPARFFQQDKTTSGAMFLDSDAPGDLVYDYTKYYALYKIFTPRVQNALVIGGGAYSIPKALMQALPQAQIDVAEIEPSLFDLAKKYFRVTESSRLHNRVADGRRLLSDSPKTYDLMFSDVYYSLYSVPPHLTTREFFTLAKKRLNTGGVFIANVIGDLSRQQPSLIMAEIKTFQSVFPNAYFFAESPERTDSQNIILVGYNADKQIDLESAPVSTSPDPFIKFIRFKVVDVKHRFELSPDPVLTDNFSPVEYLTAQVLRRAFGKREDLDGAELVALTDQQRRYAKEGGETSHNKMRDFLVAELKQFAQEVQVQTWTETRSDGSTYEAANVIARFYSSQQRRVVLATRYTAEAFARAQGPDTSPETPRSNSAGGVAVLLGLARMFDDSPTPPDVGVDLVFFDDRDAANHEPAAGVAALPAGSEHFAEHLSDIFQQKPVSSVVLDLGCSDHLNLLRESSSVSHAPAQVEALWSAGKKIDAGIFGDAASPEIIDDHSPLNRAGIPSVLLSDANDSKKAHAAEKCNPKSLATVTRAVFNSL